MQDTRTPIQQAAEDVFFGQVVMIWARWFIILATAIVIFWSASSTSALALGILPVVALMAMNFYLHGRYLMEQPANRYLIGVASALDLAIISFIVLIGALGRPGLQSPLFVFYYPVILGFALVFRPHFTTGYALVTMVVYMFACAVNGMSFDPTQARCPDCVRQCSAVRAMALLDRLKVTFKALAAPADDPREMYGEGLDRQRTLLKK